MALKLFPHVLIRLGGRGFDPLGSLSICESLSIINEILQLKESLSNVKNTICDRLYQVIPKEEEPRARNLLLNCKRAVFNERTIAPEILDEIISHLPHDLKEELIKYMKIKESLEEHLEEGEYTFKNEVSLLRHRLQHMIKDDVLQKGLVLSSQSLYNCIPSYLSKPEPVNKKDFQTERGLMKYISRMYAKTSPFSTFSKLSLGKVEPCSEKNPSFFQPEKKADETIRGHVRLNSELYRYLMLLVYRNRDVYRHLLLRINPTLKQDEMEYTYLSTIHGEKFRRIPVNAVMNVFLRLAKEKEEGTSIKEITRHIVENKMLEASGEEIEAYLLELVEYGLLECNPGVSGSNPDWDIQLIKILEAILAGNGAVPFLGEIIDTLKNLRARANQYEDAPHFKRKEILHAAFNRFKALCFSLHEAAGLPGTERLSPVENTDESYTSQANKNPVDIKNSEAIQEFTHPDEEDIRSKTSTVFRFTPSQMFYEDTTASFSCCLKEENLVEFTGLLHDLLQKMRCFEVTMDEREKLRHFFSQRYGHKTSVDFMKFYEDYSGEYLPSKKKGAHSIDDENDSSCNISTTCLRHQKNKDWMKNVLTVLKEEVSPDYDVIRLTSEQLEKARRKMGDGIPLAERPCSYGSLVQFFIQPGNNNEEHLVGVINLIYPGLGKLFSRFMHLFNREMTDQLCEWNNSLSSDGAFILSEGTDVFYLNGNLHPPLLSYEIHVPGGHNALPSSRQIPLTELEVKPTESGRKLQLIHKPTQKRIYVENLGFHGHRGRSSLFQLLEYFNISEYLTVEPLMKVVRTLVHHWEKPVEESDVTDNPDETIRIYPRVVYNDQIILNRKTWIIPSGKLPVRRQGETDWEYFVKVDGWRRGLRIPDEVFVHVKDGVPSILKPVHEDENSQYISFRNPFLVDLFEKLILQVPFALKIVEMLPNSNELLKVGDTRQVSEFTLQWYTGVPVSIGKVPSNMKQDESGNISLNM